MPNIDVIESKIDAIKKYLRILEPVLSTVSIDSLEMYAVERLFQLIVDSAIDINTHIIGGIKQYEEYIGFINNYVKKLIK